VSGSQESGRVRLHYTTTRWDGERRESDYWISLTTTSQHFGGRRWWFVCPRTGRRADKLYLPNGAFTFAARQAYRLAYRSQREAPHDRALRRAFKLRGKLGADGGIGDYVPKPEVDALANLRPEARGNLRRRGDRRRSFAGVRPEARASETMSLLA
jgi:hypothetical protein